MNLNMNDLVTCPAAARRRRGHPRLPGLVAVMVAALVLVAGAGAAHARGKLIDLHGALLAGAMTGDGSHGVTPDVFHETRGLGLGFDLGVRLLVMDLSVRFVQMLSVEGHHGTLLSALIGPSIEIPVKYAANDPSGKRGPPEIVVRPGLAGGLAFGSLSPVTPPINNAQLDAKGLLIIGRFAVERMYGPIVGLGGEIQGGYHYFVGANSPINGQDHASGWQVGAFATLAFHFGV